MQLAASPFRAPQKPKQGPSTRQGDPSKQDTPGREGLAPKTDDFQNILQKHQMRTACELANSDTDWFSYLSIVLY